MKASAMLAFNFGVNEVNDDTFGRLNYAASQAIVFNFSASKASETPRNA